MIEQPRPTSVLCATGSPILSVVGAGWMFLFSLTGCGSGAQSMATQGDAAPAGNMADASQGEASGSDGGTGGVLSNLCPASAPAMGSSCSNEGVYCEYGSSFESACNDVLVCVSGTWGDAVLFGMAECDAGAGPNPSSCPSAESDVTNGSSCNIIEACAYPQGVCECVVPPDSTSGTIDTTWFCGPQPGCPMPRPRLGSVCATAGQECDYESCGNSQICQNGIWQTTLSACGG